MWNRKARLFGTVQRMRTDLDEIESEIAALNTDESDTATFLVGGIDADLETMRERLGALEMRVEAIEGVPA